MDTTYSLVGIGTLYDSGLVFQIDDGMGEKYSVFDLEGIESSNLFGVEK